MWEFFKDFASPSATILAASVAAIITYYFGRAQARIAQSQRDIALDKLKHDLFDNRNEIYQTAKKLLETIPFIDDLEHSNPTNIRAAYIKLDEGRFYFPPDICAVLNDIHDRCELFFTHLGERKNININIDDSELWGKSAETLAADQAAMRAIYATLPQTFEPALAFTQLTVPTALPRREPEMTSKSEQRAAWVSAIATSIQTIAVVATLFFVAKEWSAHERQDLDAKKDSALRLSVNSPTLDFARNAINQFVRCHSLKRASAASLTTDDQKYLDTRCSPILLDNDATFSIALRPLSDHVDQAVACLRAGLCDRATISAEFCDDAKLLHNLLLETEIGSGGALHRSDFPGYVDFICTQ